MNPLWERWAVSEACTAGQPKAGFVLLCLVWALPLVSQWKTRVWKLVENGMAPNIKPCMFEESLE